MKPGESLISPTQNYVSDGYFEAMKIRLAQAAGSSTRETLPRHRGRSSSTSGWRRSSGRARIRSAGACTCPTNPKDVLKITAETTLHDASSASSAKCRCPTR